jgi:hypothetical protein
MGYSQSVEDSRHEYERIKQLAHELWEKAGRPQGADLFFWTQAEQKVKEPWRWPRHMFSVGLVHF